MPPTRRTFLRAAGVAVALPALERFASAAPAKADVPRRMVCINTPLGLHPAAFFPTKAGKDYPLSPYLELLKDLRDDFTVMSGLTHPDVGPSHDSNFSFLTAAPHPEQRAGFKNSISVDQLAAEHLRGKTRFASLPISCEGFTLSWTRSGAMVPAELWPSGVFAKLFIDGKPDEVAAQKRKLKDGQSILDAVRGQAKSLRDSSGGADREKLDEYFTSVRELEQTLVESEEWAKKPKPKVDAKPSKDVANSTDLIAKTKAWFDLIHLALQTDSTRVVTLQLLGTSGVPPVDGVQLGHHDLSHHGKDESKIGQLKKIEVAKVAALGEFLTKLKTTKEGDGTLLDRTSVFFGSNLGDASTHAVKNLPVLLAGGGFKHGQHLAFDKNPPPLANLFVSMLQRLGVEADKFASATGTLTGLDFAA